ncbi:unnamed protein product, partial [Effrenium voratum]
ALCLHFRFTYESSLPSYGDCDLLSTGPSSGNAGQSVGIIAGPRSCASRAVLYFRPRGNLFLTTPSPIVRGIPVALSLKGEHFDPAHDRVAAIYADYACGDAALPSSAVAGTWPSTWEQWASLPCNDTSSAPELLICGRGQILFEQLGAVRFCVCDAGAWPFGCEAAGPKAFDVHMNVDLLDVAGPTTDNLGVCPAGRECTITGAA